MLESENARKYLEDLSIPEVSRFYLALRRMALNIESSSVPENPSEATVCRPLLLKGDGVGGSSVAVESTPNTDGDDVATCVGEAGVTITESLVGS